MVKRKDCLGPSIVVLFLVLYTITAGVVFCFNTLILYIQYDFKVDLALLELLGALPASLQGLAAPLAMWLSFKFGIWPTVALGTVLTTTGLLLSAFARSFGFLFFTYAGLTSVGILLLINPPFYLVDQIYPYHHPRHVLATSITACGFPLASLIINPVSNKLALEVGWQHTYIILGVTLFASGTAWVIVAAMWARNDCMGSVPEDGVQNAQGEEIGQVNAEQYKESEETAVQVSVKLKVGICLLWTLASIAKCTAYYTPFLTLVKYMDTIGIPRNLSWRVMPVIGASELVSRLLVSWIGDYLKRTALYMYASACFILAVVNILGSFSQAYVHFMLYGAALGIFGGPIIASLYACSAEVLYGQEVPLVFSLFRTGIGLACLVGPVIAGGMHDILGTFHPIFYVYAALYLLSSIIYVIIILINKYHRPGTESQNINLLDGASIAYQSLENANQH